MKRFVCLLCIIMFTLTGCSPPWDKDKAPDFEPTGANISGTIISVQPVNVELEGVDEEGTVISEVVEYTNIDILNFDDETYNVYINSSLGTEDLHQDTKVNLVAYVDNNSSKWNSLFSGKKIISPKELLNRNFDYIIVARLRISLLSTL